MPNRDSELIRLTKLKQRDLALFRPHAQRAVKPIAQVLDLFSGCGGMSLGFAGPVNGRSSFRLLGGVDLNAISLATYERNFGVPALQRDVRALAKDHRRVERMLAELSNFDDELPLVLIGCAPCQGFTSHRKKSWSEDDARNSLVVDFATIAARMRPAYVIMENVPELLSGRYWPFFEAFRAKMIRAGYSVQQSIHNAAEFGVPQERFRAVVMATRTDVAMPLPMVARVKFRTVRDAIADLPRVKAGAASPSDPYHRSASHRPETIRTIKAIPRDGGSRPAGVGPKCLDRIKGFSDVYGRLAWDRPAITITHYARNPASGRFVHPVQDRGLTMREAARLQGFPDGFEFAGGFDEVFRQIGEAVPPPFAAAIASAIECSLRSPELPAGPRVLKLVTGPVSNSFSSVIAGLKRARG